MSRNAHFSESGELLNVERLVIFNGSGIVHDTYIKYRPT